MNRGSRLSASRSSRALMRYPANSSRVRRTRKGSAQLPGEKNLCLEKDHYSEKGLAGGKTRRCFQTELCAADRFSACPPRERDGRCGHHLDRLRSREHRHLQLDALERRLPTERHVAERKIDVARRGIGG